MCPADLCTCKEGTCPVHRNRREEVEISHDIRIINQFVLPAQIIFCRGREPETWIFWFHKDIDWRRETISDLPVCLRMVGSSLAIVTNSICKLGSWGSSATDVFKDAQESF